MRAPRRTASGFTLIELVIVIAVVAILAAAAMPALSSLTGANARAAAGELAGSMRWLFDTAALRHETCRMVLDLDGRAWWAECTDTEGRGGPVLDRQGAPPEEATPAGRFPDEEAPEARKVLRRARFGELSDRLVGRRELPGGAAFEDVWTPRQREPVSSGKAYVYFFPRGQAEPVRVPVADGANVYSVVLEPLTGRARVVVGKPEVPR